MHSKSEKFFPKGVTFYSRLPYYKFSYLLSILTSMKTIHLYNYRYIVQETHTFRDAKAFDTSLQLNATPQIKTIMHSLVLKQQFFTRLEIGSP